MRSILLLCLMIFSLPFTSLVNAQSINNFQYGAIKGSGYSNASKSIAIKNGQLAQPPNQILQANFYRFNEALALNPELISEDSQFFIFDLLGKEMSKGQIKMIYDLRLNYTPNQWYLLKVENRIERFYLVP